MWMATEAAEAAAVMVKVLVFCVVLVLFVRGSGSNQRGPSVDRTNEGASLEVHDVETRPLQFHTKGVGVPNTYR